jgi:hypothetical protein
MKARCYIKVLYIPFPSITEKTKIKYQHEFQIETNEVLEFEELYTFSTKHGIKMLAS